MKALILAMALTACATSPLNDPRVSKQWAVDVCAERDDQIACMVEGLTVAPAIPST